MVREGYKQTEVGIIPEDWINCSIQDLVAEGILEKPLDGNHGNIHPKSRDYVYFGIPFIMSNNVQNGRLDTKSCHFIRKEQADKLQKGFSFEGDVLLTHKGTVGNVTIVSNISTEYIMLTPQVTYYRVRDCNRLKNTFIKFYFESPIFQAAIENLSGGGTRAYIGITSQRQLPFVLPPFPEQCAIAQALSDVDALIAALDRLIAKKRNLKTATMQQILTGKKRLPGFVEGQGYKQTEVGVIPEDWDVASLTDVSINGGLVRGPFGGTLKKEFFVKSGYKVYEQRNAIYRSIEIGNYFIDSKKFNELRRFEVSPGDLIVSCSGTIGCIYKIPECAPKGVINQALLKIILNDSVINSKFFLSVFCWENFQEKITENSHGGAMQNLVGMDTFRNTLLQLPSLPEQGAIATVLSDMDAEIAALETRLVKTQAIKQGMMQEFLTGRVRLKIET